MWDQLVLKDAGELKVRRELWELKVPKETLDVLVLLEEKANKALKVNKAFEV